MTKPWAGTCLLRQEECGSIEIIGSPHPGTDTGALVHQRGHGVRKKETTYVLFDYPM